MLGQVLVSGEGAMRGMGGAGDALGEGDQARQVWGLVSTCTSSSFSRPLGTRPLLTPGSGSPGSSSWQPRNTDI